MTRIKGTKKRIFSMMCLGLLFTLIGGAILTFSPSSVYADSGKLWVLDSNGDKIAGLGKTWDLAGWYARGYYNNGDGLGGVLFWSQPDKGRFWLLDNAGDKIAGIGKTWELASWTAKSFYSKGDIANNDLSGVLLWGKPGWGRFWQLDSNGEKIPGIGKTWTLPGWEAQSYHNDSMVAGDLTGIIVWTKSGWGRIWQLDSNGEKIPGIGRTWELPGWEVQSYHNDGLGEGNWTGTLLWTKSGWGRIWVLDANGDKVPGVGKTWELAGWTASFNDSPSSIAAGKWKMETFEEGMLAVRKAGSGAGTITAGTQVCDATCTELTVTYVAGEQIELAVEAAEGSKFVGWEAADGTSLMGDTYYASEGETMFAVFELE